MKSQPRLVCLNPPAFGKIQTFPGGFETRVCGSRPRLRLCFAALAAHWLECSISPALLAAIYSWQLQPTIRLLSCAMLQWPCSLYPASPGRMTADKSPGLLLATSSVCNSTARECAFSYEAHHHKSTKDRGASHRQIALKLQQHFLWQFIDRDNCHCSKACAVSFIASAALHTAKARLQETGLHQTRPP